MEKKKKEAKMEKEVVLRRNIRCRECLITDGYKPGEDKCRHCGAKLFEIDKV